MAQRWGVRPSAILSGPSRDFLIDSAVLGVAGEVDQAASRMMNTPGLEGNPGKARWLVVKKIIDDAAAQERYRQREASRG